MNTWVTVVSLLAFAVLTVGTGVFVAAEFSLTALERGVVEANARGGDRRDRLVAQAHRTLSFQLSGAQLGISVTTLATGYLAEPVLARWLRPALHHTGLTVAAATAVALLAALAVATSVSMVFGELVPKNIAVAHPLPTARAVAGSQLLFSRLFAPAIRLTNGTANAILRLFGVQPAERLHSARSPSELASLVRTSARSGALDAATATLVDRSLRFGALTAAELMTPRSKIVALHTGDSIAELARVAGETGFSCFPVIDGDLDDTVGMVHVRQVFEVDAARRDATPVTTRAVPAATVPSTLDGDAVTARVQASALQVVLVVDEYGGTAGLVTTEDLIEEIVGDVRDEYDDTAPDVVRGPDGWQVAGLLRIDEVRTATGFHAPPGPYETIGGLVLRELGHIPHAGESVVLTVDDDPAEPRTWLARVMRMDGRRIDVLTLTELDGGP